ncbi:MAG: preprotein translocase subunit SecE [Planctomycetota bacterium]
MFIVGAITANRYLNKTETVDALIDTEAELKKVTWPTFNETVNASLVVVGFVVALTGYLWLSDRVLSSIFTRVLGIGG